MSDSFYEEIEAQLAAVRPSRGLPTEPVVSDDDGLVEQVKVAAESLALFEAEAAETEQNSDQLQSTVVALESMAVSIREKGVSREHAQVLTSYEPGILSPGVVNSFTVLPSKTNQKLALESFAEALWRNFKRAVEAVVNFIRRCWSWLLDFFRKTFGLDSRLPEAAAQAITATEAAADVRKLVEDRLPKVVDAKLIEDKLKQNIIEPLEKRLSVAGLGILDPDLPRNHIAVESLGLAKNIVDLFNTFDGQRNVLSRARAEIDNVDERLTDFEDRARREDLSIDKTTPLMMFGQVCAPLLREVDRASNGFLQTGSVKSPVQGKKSALTDAIVLDPDRYPETCSTVTRFIKARLVTPIGEQMSMKGNLRTTALLKPDTYRDKDFMSRFSARLKDSVGQLKLNPGVELSLKEIDGRLNAFKDRLIQGCSDSSLAVQEFSKSAMLGLKSMQADVMLISNTVMAVRSLQGECMSTLVSVERTQREIIGILRLAVRDEVELSQEVDQLIQQHKDAHAAARLARRGR